MIFENKKIFDFKNNVVLISGCNGQLGKDLLNFFLENNAIVYGFDIKQSNFKSRNFNFLKGDITDLKFVHDSLKKIVKKEKKINVIINNAAVQLFSNFIKRKKKENLNLLNVNLIGALNFINSYQTLHKHNIDKYCRIINIGSIYGYISPDFSIYKKGDRFSSELYGISKSGIIQMTKYYAVLYAKKNITINSISPGGILNFKKQNKSFISRYCKNVPVGRMANTQDLLTAVAMFSSKYSSYTSGQNLIIDGALSIK